MDVHHLSTNLHKNLLSLTQCVNFLKKVNNKNKFLLWQIRFSTGRYVQYIFYFCLHPHISMCLTYNLGLGKTLKLRAAGEEQSLFDLGLCSLSLEVTLWVEMLSSARNRMPDLEVPQPVKALNYLAHRKSRGRLLQVRSTQRLNFSNSCNFPLRIPRVVLAQASQLPTAVFKGTQTEGRLLPADPEGNLVPEAP